MSLSDSMAAVRYSVAGADRPRSRRTISTLPAGSWTTSRLIDPLAALKVP